jgi:hypothetical protein
MVTDGARLASGAPRSAATHRARSVPQMIHALNAREKQPPASSGCSPRTRARSSAASRCLHSTVGARRFGNPTAAPAISSRCARHLREWDLPMDYVVVGSSTLSISLDAN